MAHDLRVRRLFIFKGIRKVKFGYIIRILRTLYEYYERKAIYYFPGVVCLIIINPFFFNY